VPYIDMVNHSCDAPNADVRKDEFDNWVLYAIKPIKENEQIFINYDPDPSNELMFTYGFVDMCSENPSEKINLASTEVSLHPAKYGRIEKCGLYNTRNLRHNTLSITGEGCSWGLQKAVVLTVVSKPEDLGVTCYSEFIGNGLESYVPHEVRNLAELKLREIIQKKVQDLTNLVGLSSQKPVGYGSSNGVTNMIKFIKNKSKIVRGEMTYTHRETKKVVKFSPRLIDRAVQDMEENRYNNNAEECLANLFTVQKRFLEGILQRNESLYTLIDARDRYSGDSDYGSEGF